MHTKTHEHETSLLDVTLIDEDSALSRLLGVLRRRGFRVVAMEAESAPTGQMRVRARLQGARCPETLRRHVANLFDVDSATLVASRVAVV